MNLNLLSKLQTSDSVYLILQPKLGGIIDYYIIARNISFDLVSSGQMNGTVENDRSLSFEIRLASILPLINKGYQFNIKFENNQLVFVTEDDKVVVKPSYVESRDSGSFNILGRYMELSAEFQKLERIKNQYDNLYTELLELKRIEDHNSLMNIIDNTDNLSEVVESKVDRELRSKIEMKEKELSSLQSSLKSLQSINLKPFIDIATVASKAHTVVDMCDEYAIVDLGNSFLIEKSKCPVLSIQGVLFSQLLKDGGGEGFYLYKDELVYINGNKDITSVFIAKYLPNNSVDASIVKNGVVTERYEIRIHSLLKVISLVKSSFKDVSMDMNTGQFILTNDLGEVLRINFDVDNVNSLQLIKSKSGKVVQGGIKLAIINIPVAVQNILGYFKDSLIIYVKKNKIVFQNKSLFLVFGR